MVIFEIMMKKDILISDLKKGNVPCMPSILQLNEILVVDRFVDKMRKSSDFAEIITMLRLILPDDFRALREHYITLLKDGYEGMVYEMWDINKGVPAKTKVEDVVFEMYDFPDMTLGDLFKFTYRLLIIEWLEKQINRRENEKEN